jgi:alpha-beta hydrolase superfamily lysophospholipase
VRPVELGDVILQLEPPEAGRYHAPILIVPGLFQSATCWRPLTTMLAHRGWEVYSLVRQPVEGDDEPLGGDDRDWTETVHVARRAAKRFGDKYILFGADVGASIALAVAEEVRPLAMALFAPADPPHVGAAYARALGFFEKRRARRERGPLGPPASLRRAAPLPSLPALEPRSLVESMLADAAASQASVPRRAEAPRATGAPPPPRIVFGVTDDPLVATEHASAFVDGPHAKLASTTLSGRWWPTTEWQAACDEVHRFLVLTLGDRVVEFPDEVLEP